MYARSLSCTCFCGWRKDSESTLNRKRGFRPDRNAEVWILFYVHIIHGSGERKYKGDVLSQFRADTSKMVNRIIQNKGSMRKKTALPVRGSAAGSVFFGNRVQAGSGDAVGRFGKSGAGGPNGFLTRISFRRGVGADLRRRAAQGVHEKAAGRLAREGRESLFFSGRGKYSGVMKNWCARWLKMVISSGFHCMAHVDLARQPIEKSVEEIRGDGRSDRGGHGKTSGIHTSAVWFMEYGASGEGVDDAGCSGTSIRWTGKTGIRRGL